MADRKTRRRNRLLILAAGLALTGGTVVAAKFGLDWRRNQRASQALTRGMLAYAKGDYARALPDLGRAAGHFRDNSELMYAVSDTRWRIPETDGRHIASAIAFARAARDGAPDDLRPRLLLLDLYRTAGFVTELLDEADDILAADPASRDAHQARIGALLALGRRDHALDAANTALAANPTEIDSLQILIDVMLTVGRPQAELQAELDKHAGAFEQNAQFAILAGIVAARAEDEASALQHAHTALAMDLHDPAALQAVVRFADRLAARDLSLFPKSSAAIDAAMADPYAAPHIATFVLERDWRLMQIAAGRGHAAALDPANPDLPPEALAWAATLATGPESERHEQALRACPESITRDAWLAALEASRALESGDLVTARAALDRVHAAAGDAGPTTPICPPAALAEARLLLAAGDSAAARNTLRRLGFERDWLIARADLLFLLLGQNSIVEAMVLLRDDPLLANLTSVPEAFAAASASLIVSRQVGPEVAAEVLSFVAQIAEASPEAPELQAYYAVALLGSNRRADAQAILANLDQEALSEDTRIMLAAAAGGSEVAPADIDRLLANPPQDPDALLRAAMIVAAATETATGLELIENAARSAQPARQLPLRIARAMFLDRIGDPSARAELIAVAEENPDSMPAQLAVLESAAAWSAAEGLDRTVARLRALTGEDKASWRIHEARRLLAFDATEATTAIAISLLTEARQTSWPNPTISDLLATAALRDPTDPAARQRAIRHLVEGVQTSPDGAILYPRLVLLLRVSGDAPEAARQLDALLTRDSISPRLRLTRADLALVAGRYDEALRDYRVLAQSGDFRSRLGEANALVGLGSWPQAESIYAELAAQPEPAPGVLLDYAASLAAYGHFDRAVQVLGGLPDRVNNDPRDLVIADFHTRYAPPEQAEQHLKALADAADTEIASGAALRLTRFYIQHNRLSDALATADLHMQRHPNDASLREVRALARLSMGGDGVSVDELAELARIARERDPDSTYARLTAVMSERANDTISQAIYIVRLESLIRRDPVFLPTRAALVQAYRVDGRLAEAATAASQASEAVPESTEAAAQAARALADAGQFVGATVYIARWKSLLRTPSPDPDILAAAIALDQGRPQEARVALTGWLDQLVSQARETGAHRPIVAAVLALNGRSSDAQALFADGPLDSVDAPDYFNVGSIMVRSNPEVASTWELAALARVAENTDRAFIAGRLLTIGTEHGHQPSLTASLEILNGLESAGAGNAQTAAMRASAQALLNQTTEAILNYRQALQRDPEDLLAMNNLAMLLARSPETAVEAVERAKSALDQAERVPDLPPQVMANILDTYGLCLLASGNPTAAHAAFTRGLDLDPTSLGCQIGIAESFLAQDDLDSAARALARFRPTTTNDAEASLRLERVQARLR